VATAAANNFDGTGGSHNRVSYIHSSSDETINLVTGQGSGIAGSYSAGDTYTNIQDVTPVVLATTRSSPARPPTSSMAAAVPTRSAMPVPPAATAPPA
jgi:hypothetical protein